MRAYVFIFIFCSMMVFSAVKADLFISPAGNDNWSGTRAVPNTGKTDGPFATIERAKIAVRALTAKRDGDITVLLRGGMYHHTRTVVFSCEDSARQKRTITYAAYPGETPILSAGVPLRTWKKIDPAGVPEKTRGNVYAADASFVLSLRSNAVIPHGAGLAPDLDDAVKIKSIFDPDGMLARARGKGFRPELPYENIPQAIWKDYYPITIPRDAVGALQHDAGIELLIIPMYYWIMNILPVTSIDRSAGRLMALWPATYLLKQNHMEDMPSAWIENAPEYMDEVGEWFFDPRSLMVYVYSPSGQPKDIIVPVLTEIIRVEGDIHYDAASDEAVRGIQFKGLTFAHGERLSLHGGTGLGLQHDWEMFDRPSALMRFRGAAECAVIDCRFADTGHAAIRLDLTCISNRIVGNRIENIGGTAVLLCGYGPGTKDVNRNNEVRNNYIHHTGRIYWGSPAVFAWQSGENVIVHNHIHHTPYAGIVVSGRIAFVETTNVRRPECSGTVRWPEVKAVLGEGYKTSVRDWWKIERFLHGRSNMIEHNDVHNVMEMLGDGNAVYISGTGCGNMVRENYLHDSFGKYMNAVIRNDDNQHGTTFDGNIMVRTHGWGEGIINKGSNIIVNNIIADLRGNDSHRGYIVFNTAAQNGSVVRYNTIFSRRSEQAPYSEEVSNTRNKTGSLLRQTDADRNCYWNTEDAAWGTRHLNAQRPFGIEANSICADPQFEDTTLRTSFRFAASSRLRSIGIPQPFDIRTAGLEEPYRSAYVGASMYTEIEPPTATLWKPVMVTIRASEPAAVIRYTIDGTEPTEAAVRYNGPFMVKNGCTLKAKSFSPGKKDLIGAEGYYVNVPGVYEDFDAMDINARSSAGQTVEDGELTARVTDEKASSGTKCLKFKDGPGGKNAFTPHVYYKVNFDRGNAVMEFDVMVDEGFRMNVDWREYGKGGAFTTGPAMQIGEGGTVICGGRTLMTIPVSQWAHVTMTAAVGENASGTFDLAVSLSGGERKSFPGLRYDAKFRTLTWVGFISYAEAQSSAFVDNVRISAVDKRDE